MRFDVITLFPELFAPLLTAGITRRAYESGLVEVCLHNPRDFAQGNYRRVDDRPFGGGPGMVMMAEPLEATLLHIRAQCSDQAPVVLFSPIGSPLKHEGVEAWSQSSGAILLCGRYEGIDQRLYLTYDNQKLPLLEHLIRELEVQNMIIFTSRKSNVNQIVRSLRKMGFEAEGIMSDLTQEEREKALQGFKNRKYKILVATDILSRGIDIDSLSHVVNFDMPQDAEDYVHRIGRTARAERTGTAITFVNGDDLSRFKRIEELIGREVKRVPNPEGIPVMQASSGNANRSHRHPSGYKRMGGGAKHHQKRRNPNSGGGQTPTKSS